MSSASRAARWATVLSAGLCLAGLDQVVSSIVSGGSKPPGWAVPFAAFAAVFVCTVVAMLVGGAVFGLVCRRVNGHAVMLSVAAACGCVVVAGDLVLTGDAWWPHDLAGRTYGALILLACVWLSWRAYRGACALTGRVSSIRWVASVSLMAAAQMMVMSGVWCATRFDGLYPAGAVLTILGVGGLVIAARWLARSAGVGSQYAAASVSRAGFGVLTALAGVTLILGLAAVVEPAPAGGAVNVRSRPHRGRRIILLTVDTLRADRLGCYGGPVPTPHIDSLADGAVLYENAVSPAPWTLPAFASMMTGLYPVVHQATGHAASVPENIDTLAERLQRAGFLTAAIGDNPFLLPESGMDQGFSRYRFFGGPGGMSSVGRRILHGVDPVAYVTSPTTDALAEMACRWLTRHGGEDFFLWVHFFDPHLPYSPPARYAPGGEPPPGMGGAFDDLDAVRGGYIGTTRRQRDWIRQLYDAEVRGVDDGVGRVLATLKTLGLYDDAVIVFASDHGEEFWDHGGFEHGHSLHRELLHVPLIVRSPGSRLVSRRVTRRVSTAAVMPTMLDLAGVPYAADELSVASLKSAEPATPVASPAPGGADRAGGDAEHDAIYCGALLYYDDREGVLFDHFKYTRSRVSGTESLYDLAADPAETATIAAQNPAVLHRARGVLDKLVRDADARRARLHIKAQKAAVSSGRLRTLRSLGYVE